MIKGAVESEIIKIMVIKSLKTENSDLLDFFIFVLGYLIKEEKMSKENTIEGKRKVLINNLIDACIV